MILCCRAAYVRAALQTLRKARFPLASGALLVLLVLRCCSLGTGRSRTLRRPSVCIV